MKISNTHYVTATEAAEMLEVTLSRIAQLRRSGKLGSARLDGRTLVICRSDVNRLAKALKNKR